MALNHNQEYYSIIQFNLINFKQNNQQKFQNNLNKNTTK